MKIQPIIFLTVLSAIGSVLRSAEAVDIDSLLRNSPFGGIPRAEPGRAMQSAVEFRGVAREGTDIFFSLYEPSTRLSVWVAENEGGNFARVLAYDPVHESVTVEYRGRTLTLPLASAKLLASNATAFSPVPAASISPDSAPLPATGNPPPDPGVAVLVENFRKRLAEGGTPRPTQASP